MASTMQPSNHSRWQDRLNWLAKIYRVYAADLQRSIYSRVGDLALAEDLTSTVFLNALRWLREDQSLESARGWLYSLSASGDASIPPSLQFAPMVGYVLLH